MRRIAAVLAAVGLAATAAACSGGSDEARVEAAAERFCGDLADYLGLREVLAASHEATPPVRDPRVLLAPLARVRAPAALTDAWQEWQQDQQAEIALDAVRAAGGRLPVGADPESPASPADVDRVNRFWERRCTADRGYEPAVPFSGTDPELPPYDQAPDAGEIRVVEYGLTATEIETGALEYYGVSYGVIVENTGEHVAAGVELAVEVVDGPGGGGHTIPILLPGQRYGLGGEYLREGPGPALGTDLTVTVTGVTGWWPDDHPAVTFHELTMTDIMLRPPPSGDRPHSEFTEVAFTVDSPYRVTLSNVTSGFPYQQTGSPHVVFRDPDGAIVGGVRRGHELNLPPGRSHLTVSAEISLVGHADVAVDPDRTEVYY